VALRREDLDGEDIHAGFEIGIDGKLVMAKRADDVLRVGDLLSVDPDVGAISDSVEVQVRMA